MRRSGGARAGGFPGAELILSQIDQGVAKKRVGIQAKGRAPVREGALLIDPSGREVGVVTSGGFGPTASTPVAMAYVETGFANPGTALSALVRGKALPVDVVKLPFVKQRYYRVK